MNTTYLLRCVSLIVVLAVSSLVSQGAAPTAKGGPTRPVAPSPRDAGPPIQPSKVLTLFDGKDLSSFYTWLVDLHYRDPDRVFTIVKEKDGSSVLRISGQHFGGLVTRHRYTNYRFTAEFRWGTETWGARKKTARDSGILLHCQGEDGNSRITFNAPWPRSVEYQVIEGGTGDMLMVGGYERGTPPRRTGPEIQVAVTPGSKVWNPNGVLQTFSSQERNVRLDWYGRDPNWKNEIDFRGAKDLEKPNGEWNTIEFISDGDHLIYYVNGIKVNEGFACSYREGQILIQSEGAEVFYRNIKLHPLPPK